MIGLSKGHIESVIVAINGITEVEENMGDLSFGHGPILLFAEADYDSPVAQLVYDEDEGVWVLSLDVAE